MKMACSRKLRFNRKVFQTSIFIILGQFTVLKAIRFSGITSTIDSLQNFQAPGWNYVKNWNSNAEVGRPGIFLAGFSKSSDDSTFAVNIPGVYYISYSLHLKTTSQSNIIGGLVIDSDLKSGLALQSYGNANVASSSLAAAGFIRLTSFNNISVALKAIDGQTNAVELLPGSSFSVASITTAGMVPAFSFSLTKNLTFVNNNTGLVTGWSEDKKGEFHVSTGFVNSKNFVQVICDGIYLFSANIVIKGPLNSKAILTFTVNLATLHEIKLDFQNQTTLSVNIHQIMSSYKADIVKISITSFDSKIEILKESSFSASLINKISQHTTGFASFLRFNFTIPGNNVHLPITGWPTDFNGVAEFKSPNLFAQLVNNKQDFNPPQRGIYLITTNLVVQCDVVTCTDVTVSIYSPASKFVLASKTITRIFGPNQSAYISVTSAADITSTSSFAVAVKSKTGKVFVMPGSSFAVCQLPIYYPGMLARLTKPISFSVIKHWQTVTGWKTSQIKGDYDFFGNMNETSGKYEIPLDGIYLLSANVIIVDMEQAEAFITVGKTFDLTKGFFTSTGNPQAVTTLNFGGLMNLKRGDQVYLTIKSDSDSDWSVKENSGFSVAYIGQSSHALLASVKDQILVRSTGWTKISSLQAEINNGGSFQTNSGQFVVPVSGIYHVMVNIILQDADQVESSSKYKIAIRINDIPVSGLSASRVPTSVPPRRRYYPLFLSGSFKATKGDVISLATYSAVDSSYAILVSSSWSMFLVTEDGNSDQVGFAGPKKSNQNMFSTEASSWFDVNNWQPSSSNLGSFYTPSKINFDDSNKAIIKTTGFYLISANVEIQHSSEAPPVMKIALFIQNELQQNGITYENIRGWNSFSMHFNGAAFLIEGDTVSLKITSTSNFDGLVINKESGFSITRLPVAELFPAASLTAMAKFKIPFATSLPVKVWTAENSEASFSFTSGKRYNKTSGIFRVNTAGYYLISMNLVLQSHNRTNISLTMVHGSGSDTFELTITNGSVSSLSSTILKFQEVGSTIFIATNISLPFGNSASFNNSTSFPSSDIVLQEGSSFSAIHFPLKTTAATTSEAVYTNSYSYSKATKTELSDWTVSSEVDKSPAIYRADKDGIYFLSMNLKLIEFIGCVTFSFKSNRGSMATSTVTCKKHCQEYITLNNFVRLRNGDRLSVFMHLEPNSHLTIAKNSRRTITYMRPYEEETGLSVRIINTSLVPATVDQWVPLYKYSLGNDTHGVFDARGNYSSFEGMIIPSTGAYQVIVNLMMLFANSSSGMGTVEIVVSKDGAISTTGGLYMKKKFKAGQNFTMHVMSSVVLPKWTKLKLFIRSDADVYIQEGSTVALAYLDSIIREICRDEGPVMGDPLRPAYIASAIVGEKREWRCQAFGNKPAKHLWYKNNQVISKKEYLQIDGYLNDTGRYHCVASIDGIMAESNQVQVQIYDVDECHYKNHTCDVNALCANTLGSFTCTCNAGFVGNGFKCDDINECSLGTHNCANHSMCINTRGAFTCRCLDGFYGDGVKFCNDVDECLLSLDKCDRHATCNNLVGTYNCTCKKGWFGSGFTCSDANECTLLTHNCDTNAYCNNTNGTAKCTCKEGYFGNGVAGNCSDINECLLLPTATPATLRNVSLRYKMYCDAFADCVNLEGSYTCRCKAGFIGNGTNCQDINECELGSQSIKCAQVADCINLPGSYQCKCRAGYTGDGIQCADLDECAIKTFVCDPLANCSNTYGSYQCSCPKGYIGDGKTCADNAEIGKSTDPCVKDSTSLTCICKNSKTRDQNILCNGLFVAIIILSVVAIIVILFVVKYIKSRRNIKIGPVKTARGKYIEMEDESEV